MGADLQAEKSGEHRQHIKDSGENAAANAAINTTLRIT